MAEAFAIVGIQNFGIRKEAVRHMVDLSISLSPKFQREKSYVLVATVKLSLLQRSGKRKVSQV